MGPGSCAAALWVALMLSQTGAAPDGDESRPWDNNTPERQQKAHGLFEKGVRALLERRHEDAARDFRQAIEYDDLPLFHLNLAVALEGLQQPVEAREQLLSAVKYGLEGLDPEGLEKARAKLAAIEARLARLVLTCEQAGALIAIDERQNLYSCPGSHEAWVQPGPHVVVIRLAQPGYQPAVVKRTLAAGERADIPLRAPRDEELMVTPWPRWVPWSVMAAGTVLAGGGVWLHSQARREFLGYDAFMATCAGQPLPGSAYAPCPPEFVQTIASKRALGNQLQTWAVVSYVGGGAALAAGAVLLYLNVPRLQPREDGIAVTPILAPGVSGVVLAAEF